MKHILFIIGSLRKESFNLQLAREAEKQLAGVAGFYGCKELGNHFQYIKQEGPGKAGE
jgi:NAD(P)H-dependent FMN reductase